MFKMTNHVNVPSYSCIYTPVDENTADKESYFSQLKNPQKPAQDFARSYDK